MASEEDIKKLDQLNKEEIKTNNLISNPDYATKLSGQ